MWAMEFFQVIPFAKRAESTGTVSWAMSSLLSLIGAAGRLVQIGDGHDPSVQRQQPVDGQSEPRDVVHQVHGERQWRGSGGGGSRRGRVGVGAGAEVAVLAGGRVAALLVVV